MSFVSRAFERIFKWRRFRPPKTFEERLSWLFQPYMGTVEDVIMWRTPAFTGAVIGAVNVFFLLIWHLGLRLLGVVFASALCCLSAEGASAWLARREGIPRGRLPARDEASGAALRAAAERARQWLADRAQRLLLLRERNPPQFCLVVSCALVATALIGSMISGVVIIYILIMMVLIVPGLAPKVMSTLKGLHPHTDSDGEVEGFMPELSPQVMAELNKADEEPVSKMEVDRISDVWLPEGAMNNGGDSSSDEGSQGKTLPSILDVPPDITDSSSSNSSDDEFLPRNIPGKDRMQQQLLPSAPPQPKSQPGWSSSAFNALGSISGAIGSLLPGSPGQPSSNRYSRMDSDDSDDFELVDKDNL